MAEFVLKKSEEKLPAFEEMQRVGLFSDTEIKSIIKKTTAHEYKLVRRIKEKKDFVSYVQYKIHLLALIKKRRKKISYYFKNEEIEYIIVQEVHRLFKRCCFLWPEDLKLWLSHVEFCKDWGKKIQLSKIWTTLLQIHGNKKCHLWAMAAKWELEDNHSVDNARKIFLQGIRHHQEEPKLWHEYFRMELIHTQKMRQRLALLTEEEKDNEVTDDNFLKGEAARVIYSNAIQVIQNDVKFKCGFLDIALLFSYFAGEIINYIIDDLMDSHSDNPTARGAIARLHMNPNMQIQSELADSTSDVTRKADALSAEKRCWKEFEVAVEELDTPEMWQEYFSFLHQGISDFRATQNVATEGLGFEITGVNKNATMKKGRAQELRTDKLLEVAGRAHKSGKLNQDDYKKYVCVLVEREKLDEAIQVLKDVGEMFDSLDLRIELLNLMVKNRYKHSAAEEITSNFCSTAASTSKMSPQQDAKFWNLWLEYSISTEDEDAMFDVVEKSIKFKSAYADEIQASYLEWHGARHGLDSALELYKTKLTATRSAPLCIIKTLISLLGSTDDDRSEDMTSCFEDAVDGFGQSEPDVWLQYIAHILKIDPGRVGNIHWRAMKCLKPALVEKFVAGFTLLQTGVAC